MDPLLFSGCIFIETVPPHLRLDTSTLSCILSSHGTILNCPAGGLIQSIAVFQVQRLGPGRGGGGIFVPVFSSLPGCLCGCDSPKDGGLREPRRAERSGAQRSAERERQRGAAGAEATATLALAASRCAKPTLFNQEPMPLSGRIFASLAGTLPTFDRWPTSSISFQSYLPNASRAGRTVLRGAERSL